MATVLELKEQRSKLWERMKEINDGAEAESRNLTAEEEVNWNKATADIDDLDKRIARQEQMERKPAETRKLETSTIDPPEPQKSLRASPEYGRAFYRWMATESPLDLDVDSRSILASCRRESRALGTNVPTAAGYLIPESLETKIEQALLWYGGMREAATIMTTDTGENFAMPTSDDTSNTGELLAENTAVSEQDVTVGVRTFKAYMYSSKMIRASYQFLQDTSTDVEGWLANLLATRIGRITNTHFTTGTGANQPSGIAGDVTVGVNAATGQSTSVTWDDLITLEHSVDRAYRTQGRFMFHDLTLRELRKLKDGEGRYLWQPGAPTANIPNTVDGYPYTINNDVAQMAASATSIYFGDLKKYIIRDVRGFTLMRLAERYAEYLQVAFLGFSRHDGGLLDAGTHPVKSYVNSAS